MIILGQDTKVTIMHSSLKTKKIKSTISVILQTFHYLFEVISCIDHNFKKIEKTMGLQFLAYVLKGF